MKLRHPIVAFVLTTVTVSLAALPLSGCKDPQTTANVESDIVTAEQVVCILNNATLQNAQIATACGIAQTLIPSIEQIVGAHKKGIGVPLPNGCDATHAKL